MDSSQNSSATPSPSTGSFKAVLTKPLLGRKAEAGIASSEDMDSQRDRGVSRSSVDSTSKSRVNSADDGLPAGPSKLSKLIPGRAEKKRRKREEAVQAVKAVEEDRGRGVEDQTATSALRAPTANNRSRSTLGDGDGSLITVDSEQELPPDASPQLTSHPSHTGFLTTSSPLFNMTAPGDTGNSTTERSPSPNGLKQKSSTLPIESGSSKTLAPEHAATFDNRRGDRSPSANGGSRSRGVSPGARIRDVFTSGSRRKAGSPPKSPDRLPQASTNGSALDILLTKNSKRDSDQLDLNSEASASASSVNVLDSSKAASIGSRDIPSITTTPTTPTTPFRNEFDAPETKVTPPMPIEQRRRSQEVGKVTDGTIPDSLGHRRQRSDSASRTPSKLSQAMTAPLTPMPEESRTASGGVRTSSSGSAGGGFFSSMFTAAQNVTTTLTNTIASNPPRSRSSTQTDADSVIVNKKDEETASEAGDSRPVSQEKTPLAVDTLGSGDLSLRHLGISSDSLASNGPSSNSAGPYNKTAATLQREEAAAKLEEASATRAVSAAYTDKGPGDTPVAEDNLPPTKVRSSYEPSITNGERTPPAGSVYEGNDPPKRSGSVRSRVGGVVRKHRNSSSTTANTIGAAIGGVGSALVNPGTSRPTGFAVASKKRNREYHQLFRSVPEDDFLIEDYSCALQREIILAGRIYISEGHICFSSNILGWVTTLVIKFDEIVSVEKENTAVVFPNAIAIQTLHARQTFRSLLSREATYELLIGIWKLSHPNLKSSLNGARLDQGGTGDKTEKVESIKEDDDGSDVSDEEDGVYDEDQEDEDSGSGTENGAESTAGPGAVDDNKASTRKASALGNAAGAAAAPGPASTDNKASEKAAGASAASVDFPGPPTHGATECADGDSHYDKSLKDDIIPAPLGKVYSMVFGPASGGFMAKWLVDDMKCTDLQFEHDNKGLTEENKSRSMTYVKPLYASIGPKSTKCVVTETLDTLDLEKAVCVTASTQTPDVPSGNVFLTKTHFCFMWAANNSTRVVINYTIEWSGKSWLKGPIEKGATDGQTTYCNDLVKALKAGVSSNARSGTNGTKSKSKGGKKSKRSHSPSPKPSSGKSNSNGGNKEQASSWGPLEPIHSIVSPVTDLFAPFIGSNTIIIFLLSLILYNYLRSPSSTSSLSHPSQLSRASRIAAYEQLWRQEESELWDWLDDRIGERAGNPYSMLNIKNSDGANEKVIKRKKKNLQEKIVEDAKMTTKEVQEAIRITEEKLKMLKDAIMPERPRTEEELAGHEAQEDQKKEL